VVYYQPIVDLRKGRLRGFEALLRWMHPEKGMVMPDEFIPLAEDSGLIVPIGMWVLEESCKQAEIWQMRYPEFNAMSLSVNLSCKQFLQSDLATRVDEVMKQTHVDESTISLNLEITETVVMQNASCSTDIFRDLKALGIKLAVDDFGTGYSSLAYLQSFPVDMLKIDKQFVSRIDSNKDSYAIVKTVVDLSSNLGLAVVAEGVETQEQFRLLSEMGCQYAQGYYFSRPVPAEDAEALLAGNVTWTTTAH
jgi:EAL domain-containing protein (putative c-di-GMP-specific phosphodiesterase class I)